MAKAKSSASSATRKKHAAKAAKKAGGGDDDEVPQPPQGQGKGGQQSLQRGQKKGKKDKKDRFAPKVKVYVPPPPPPKGQPDPVDLYLLGQGKHTDPELVVVLRRLMKKDEATLAKGVEGFEQWITETIRRYWDKEGEEWERELREESVVDCMAVWAHHFPRLALHPSRRLRLQVHTLHVLLTATTVTRQAQPPLVQQTRDALLAPLWTDRAEYVGAWAVASWDTDRAVRREARRSWEGVQRVLRPAEVEGEEQADEEAEERPALDLAEQGEPIAGFALSLILGGASSGTDTPGGAPSAPAEIEDPAFLRTSALLALSYLLGTLPAPLALSENTLIALTSGEFWSLVERASEDPRRSGMAGEQPAMVRRAAYEVLGALVGRKEELLLSGEKDAEKEGEEEQDDEDEDPEEKLRVVAQKVLANCWGEEEGWPGIIAFLRRYPQAWLLADSSASTPPSPADETDEPTSSAFTPSPTLSLFLQHLTLGCSSHPTTLYPTVLLLLSTLPASVLPPTPEALSLLFESLWAAHASRALAVGGRLAVDAWASALLESVVYELGKPGGLDGEAQVALAREWIASRTWRAFLGVGGEKSIASRKTAGEVEKTLTRFAGREDRSVFDAVWEDMQREALAVFAAPGGEAELGPLATALAALAASKQDEVQARGRELARASVREAIGKVQQVEKPEEREALLKFVSEVRSLVADDADVAQLLDELALSRLPGLIASSPAALTLLVAHLSTAEPSARASIWTSLFSSPPSPSVLLSLLDALSTTPAPLDLPSAGLDDHLALAGGKVLSPDPEGAYTPPELALLLRVALAPAPLVSEDFPAHLVGLACAALLPPTRDALTASWAAPPNLDALVAPTAIVAHVVQDPTHAAAVAKEEGAAIALFDVAFLLPEIRLEQRGVYVPSEAVSAAQQAWQKLVDSPAGQDVRAFVAEKLRERTTDASLRASPVELVQAASEVDGLDVVDVLPGKAALEELYAKLVVPAPSSSLSIIDPLVSPSSSPSTAFVDEHFDDASLSPFARALVAYLDLSARDHSLLRRSNFILPHLLLLSQSSTDELSSPSPPHRSTGLFGPSPPLDVLERVASAAEGASAYLLSSLSNSLDAGWHPAAVQHLRARELPVLPVGAWDENPLLATLDALFRAARTGGEGKKSQAARGVAKVLGRVLRYADEDEGRQDAERWLALAQNMTGAPDLACAILHAIKPVLLETPRFERYQNELAASLAGVPPPQIEVKGVPVLRQLLAAAPPLDAPVIFLPQQRCMFLIQAIQRWIASDEILPEEVQVGVVELFAHLAPIVQDMSGSHWELMFDLIETNLDGADWEEPTTLPAIFHSCRLLAQIKELATRNGDLRETAKARIDDSLQLVLTLFVSRPASLNRDQPRALVVETMARLVKELPPKLLSMEKSFDQLLRLVQDSSLAVQLSSYDLLRRVIAQHVADLVVEVELDTDETVKIEFPTALLRLLDAPLRGDASPEKATPYLFAWMTAFAFFESSSPRLRSAYIEQLRNIELVTSSLLPSLFGLLNLSDRSRPVDLSPWSIDDFHFEYFDASSPLTLPIFAAHVYYRALQAVPSIIRSYWTSLQNLALSRTIHTFTSRHFSPLLVADELVVLRDPTSPIGKQLRDDDDFAVKVSANGSEVKVTYVVDEETMELGIKVPNEFPLAGVEVRDVRKVGVTDKQWRAWLLGMQQVITGQSAAIADAVLLFKRNVTSHFEGKEACAICYSTVSTVDRSLPSRPCRICPNVFHAQCLHRWFQTSGGATCPLCRSIF
ncbi:hypothetical protein JCM10207_007100 [Rhodosporidiobolus poonsookiae]